MDWEYYTLKVKVAGFWGTKADPQEFDAVLNKAGSEGWEMVGVVGMNQPYGLTKEVLFFFKRQR